MASAETSRTSTQPSGRAAAKRNSAAAGSPFGKRLAAMGWPTIIGVGTLLLWELLVRLLDVKPILLPPPSMILVTMVDRYDVLLEHLWPSLYLTILGFLLSVLGGVLFAVLTTYSEIVRKGFYPIIIVSQVIPKISIAPLFVVWFGTGAVSSLLLAFLISFFPMTVNAAVGFQTVDEDALKMARAFMGSRWAIFCKVRLPNAMPYLFGGMKISITLAIIGVVVSEFVASQEGIGYLIKLAGGLLDTPLMMAAITALSIAGLGLYGIIAWAERRIIYWQSPSYVEVGTG